MTIIQFMSNKEYCDYKLKQYNLKSNPDTYINCIQIINTIFQF